MSDDVLTTCRACLSAIASEPFEVSEHYFGGEGRYLHVECETCGTIQMVDAPDDIEALYPPLYRPAFSVPGPIKRMLLRQRGAAVRGSRWNILGRALLRRYGRPEWADWISETGTTLDSRILDVGSSDGELLVALAAAGYRHLTGIDPYIAHDHAYFGRVQVLKRRLEDHTGQYDLVMLNHSLEHMQDPAQALVEVRRLLAPQGWILVRLPVAGGYGWRTYGKHWLGLEPPRHLVVPSVEGMKRMTARAELKIVRLRYDGHGGFYAMGEAFRTGYACDGPRRPSLQRAAEIYDAAELDRFKVLAAKRNAAGDGDTAAFYIKPVGAPDYSDGGRNI